jgi:hypothetical protein
MPPGGGYGPPGAPPPGFGGPPGAFLPGMTPPGGDVNTTLPLVLSIVCLACCCIPVGAGAVVYATNANKAKQAGDLQTAQAKAKTALILSIIGMVGGVIVYTIALVALSMNNGSM